MSETPFRREGPLAAKVETVFAFVLPFFSVFYIWQATEVTEPPSNITVGARTFPLLIGFLMLAVSVVLAWQRWRARYPEASAAHEQSQAGVIPLEEDETSIGDWPAVWTVLVALVALFLLFEPLGFIAAVGLFLFVLSTLFAPSRWMFHLVISIGFSGFFYYLFTRILEIPLPKGILRVLL
ncbi:MAG TPA: tripartite tricarboxylate transporter TctB family protein, partial [Candidatus Obscuribacterales bacterium]